MVSDAAKTLKREMLSAAGVEAPPGGGRRPTEATQPPPPRAPGRAAVGRLAPARQPVPRPRLLRRRASQGAARGGWPAGSCSARCSRSFEHAASGASACMALPDPASLRAPGGLRADAAPGRRWSPRPRPGHRTFLLADEPGLGKTAQALLAAQAANAYPLLVVVPNVVKTNWAREAGLWTPNRPATVIHGDGDTIDGFADIVIVNYEVLDRHVGWLGDHRLPRHGRRRGALHQEQVLPALAARAAARPSGSGPASRARC